MMDANINQMWQYWLGQSEDGPTVIIDTVAVSGTWWGVQAMTNTVFATGTVFYGATNPWEGTTITAGVLIRGQFTDIELVSGSVVAYQYV
jgi:hypothetical protein